MSGKRVGWNNYGTIWIRSGGMGAEMRLDKQKSACSGSEKDGDGGADKDEKASASSRVIKTRARRGHLWSC